MAASHDNTSPYTGPPFSPTSGRTPKVEEDLSRADPDDLFIRFSIPEIKNVQAKFRREAGAKQEELRLMVGERYRDLLQASTSIMTISQSSQRVVARLAEMKLACMQEELNPRPSHTLTTKQPPEDEHLVLMQSLSAHIKLLLDAPEHLWRLLEQRKFLNAAWLFLLSRVVYRALVTADDEETVWQSKGIHILEQFPLVQRQWDSISHFRSNISHKATHSLREHNMSAEDTCSTLVTLHLLESLPLRDTLSHLLAQRSKTLHILLSRSIFDAHSNIKEDSTSSNFVLDVSDTLTAIFDILSTTVGVARAIFEVSLHSTSLIQRRLGAMNTEPEVDASVDNISTPDILAALPSSTHLLTLPKSIQTYRPYVDLESSSSNVHPAVLDATVGGWFARGIESLQARIGILFDLLRDIAAIWTVRAKVLEHVTKTQILQSEERTTFVGIMDNACKKRVSQVWETKFSEIQTALEHGLRASLDILNADGANAQQDILPTTHRYSSQPPPSLSLVSANPMLASNSFHSYKETLKQKLTGRTPLLHALLLTLERLAEEEKADLKILASDHLAMEIRLSYNTAVEISCERLIDILTFALDDEEDHHETLHGVMFISRLCDKLTSSSTFITDLSLDSNAESLLRAKISALHTRTLAVWKHVTVQKATMLYLSALKSGPPSKGTFQFPSQPSSQLLEVLTLLNTSAQRLGLPRRHLEEQSVQVALYELFQAITAAATPLYFVADWSLRLAQLIWDLEFLVRLSEAGDTRPNNDIVQNGDSRPSHKLQRELSGRVPKTIRLQWSSHIETSVQQQLMRMQLLLSPLLPWHAWETLALPSSTNTPLLPLGVPPALQDTHMDNAHSHMPRFVLLAS